jgi:hypothetical protein
VARGGIGAATKLVKGGSGPARGVAKGSIGTAGTLVKGGKEVSQHAAEVNEPRPAIFAGVPHPQNQSIQPKSQEKSGLESAAGQLTKEKRQENVRTFY